MKLINGRQARNFDEAAVLAFKEAGVNDISVHVTDLFNPLVDTTRLHDEAKKIITYAVRNKYGKKSEWKGKWWYVPVPLLGYETRDIPHLGIEIKTFIVAAAEVEMLDDSYLVTLVEVIGKPETLRIPMVFLKAILDDDLGRFGILARSGSQTTWEIPGAKPVRLPNDFISKLTEMLQWQSVVSWLMEFGPQGRSIVPLVAGSLLGLMFQDLTQPISVGQQMWTYEQLVSALGGMAYPVTETKEMISRAASNLRADHTLEEAIRIVLQQRGKGEQP